MDPGSDTGLSSDIGEEEAPTARWPVPDYAAPPTGAWDRQRVSTSEHAREPLWPLPEGADTGPGAGHARHGAHAAPPAAEEDPETFTFDRPSWDAPPAAQASGVLPPAEAGGRVPSADAARDTSSSVGSTPGEAQPGPRGRALSRRPVPAWETPPAPPTPGEQQPPPEAPASDGFSYWQRRPAPQDSPSGPFGPSGPSASARPAAAWAGQPAGQGPGHPMASWGSAEPEPEETPAPAPVKRAREPYLDNVKFLLIALVPAGHALVPTLAAHSSRSAYLFIYVFHMPLFVVISGYLSRNFWNSNAKTNKLVDTFLVPYVIVEVGYAVLRFALGHKWSLTIIDPAWLNWYLLALLLWRLSTPVWKRMRYPLPIAVAVYLLAGLSDLPGDFSMDRFFGLMPFFVLGLWLQPRHFEMLNRAWVKILSVGVLAGAAGVAILIAPHVPLEPIYFKDSYAELHLSWWMGMAMRVGLLIAALAVSTAIMALVPRKKTWFTDLGTRTLYCYLLHGIPVMIAKEMGWLSFPWLHGPLGVMAIMSSAFALAIVLCLPETRAVFKWLVEPRLVWLYRRPSGQAKEATT